MRMSSNQAAGARAVKGCFYFLLSEKAQALSPYPEEIPHPVGRVPLLGSGGRGRGSHCTPFTMDGLEELEPKPPLLRASK